MKLTRRRSTLLLLGLLVTTTLIVIVADIMADRIHETINPLITLGIFSALTFAYWHGWERVRYGIVIAATLLITLIQPQTFMTQQVTPLIFLPPILALILTSTVWVIGSAIGTLLLFMWRVSSQGGGTDARTLLFYGTIIGGVLLARLVTDSALHDAESNAQRAARQAEDLARKNDAIHFQSRLLDAVEQAVIATDLHGIITYCNRFAEALLSWSVNEVQGRRLSEVMPASAARQQVADVQAYVRAGASWSGEVWLMRQGSPEIFPAHLSASLVYDEAGVVIGLVWVVVDISARKQAEDELRRSEAKNRALLDLIPDLLLQLDCDGRLLSVHGTQGLDLGIAPVGAVGQPVQQLVPPELSAQIISHVKLALQQRTPQSFEYQRTAREDSGDYEARVIVSAEDDVLVIVRDITERKKIDRMKNEFISVVSHELRTPLTSIQGSLGLIAGGVAGQLPAQARVMVEIAFKNSERLVRLINDILDIEKIESGKTAFALRPQSLLAIVEQSLETNRAYAEQLGVQLQLEPATDVRVNVDSDRLMQVLTNLLSNAAKFSPTQGTVRVTIARRDQRVRIAIADQGPGIPESFRSQIFQKFAQADSSATRRTGGTGLGLSIAKTIAERLDGTLGFDTRPGAGTTFYLDLPVCAEINLPLAQVSSTASALAQSRILICEDDRDVATLLSIMLQQHGYLCDVAADTTEARQRLRSQLYAGMTLDLLLPGQDGISFIRELRADEQTRDLPIVVVSACADQGRAELNGDGFGIIDWLTKPIDPIRLDAAVAQAVHPARTAPARILHLEDDSDLRHVVAAMLGSEVELVAAANLSEARQHLMQEHFDLVLLDVALPDGSGLEVLPWLKQQGGPPTPVIIFSVLEMSTDVALQVAATLVKSRTSNQELVATIKALVSHGPPHAPAPLSLEA